MSDRSRMLHILTTRGRIRVPMVREIVARLSAESARSGEPDGLRTYKLCRIFDMLGHAELHRGRPGALGIASPHLGKLPMAGKERYVLTGARTEITVDEIQAAAAAANVSMSLHQSAQPVEEPLAPDRVLIEFHDLDGCGRLANALGIGVSQVPSAWTLACFSREMAEFENSLEWHPRDASLRDIEYYDPSLLAFTPTMDAGEGPFVCRSVANTGLMFAVKGPNEARIAEMDLGRYWALFVASVASILHDRKKRLVAVPMAAPLPRLLARSLCLCSGLAPTLLKGDRRKGTRDALVFSEIPPEIADKLAQKLGVGLVPQTINTAEATAP